MQFTIQANSEVPASVQLFDQLSFAITSGRYGVGEQLPSIRQLSAWTGLHRNTISKVYVQLKRVGLVESRGGSGMYVRQMEGMAKTDPLPTIVQNAIDQMLSQGFSLNQIRATFLAEIDWRSQCSAQLLVVAGQDDPGVAAIMSQELGAELAVPIQVATIEALPNLLRHSQASTIVTNRYFSEQTKQAIADYPVRLFLIDIYDYQKELDHIKKLPFGTKIGLVSPSTGILRIAENILYSLKGEDLVVMTALPQDSYRLQAIARTAHLVMVGHGGTAELERAIALTKAGRMRPLEVLVCQNYIARSSVQALKVELGLV
jgi:GntR family transcriptional regulator